LGPDRGPKRLAHIPKAIVPRVVLKLRRECVRKQKGNENVIIRRAFARRPSN